MQNPGSGDGGDGGVDPNALTGHALILFGGDRNDGGGSVPAKSAATALLSDDGGIGPWTETALEGAEYAFNQVASVGSSLYAPRDPISLIGTIDTNNNVAWTVGASPKRYDFCLASSGDSIFIIGGKDESSFAKSISMATVGTGTQLNWTTTTTNPLPAERNLHGCAANDKFVYTGGGKNASGMHQDGVYVAQRAPNGLGEWKATTSLPFTTYWPRFVVAANRLVLVGGEHDVVDQNSVHHAVIQADGSLGAWQIGTSLPARRFGLGVAAIGNRIYVTGGGINSGTGDLARTEVYTATIDPTTGVMSTWVPLTSLPVGRQNHGSAIVKIP